MRWADQLIKLTNFELELLQTRLADVVGLAHEPRTSPGRWVSGNVR